jgi:hypothetical protein
LNSVVAALMTVSAVVGFVKPYFSHSELKVLVGVAEGVGVGVAEGVGVGVGVAVGVGVGVAEGVGVGFGRTTFMPLSQTNFLPLLTHVYLIWPTVEVRPALEHVVPALVAAKA